MKKIIDISVIYVILKKRCRQTFYQTGGGNMNMIPISFDTKLNRLGSNCSKWDAIPYDIQADDIIPMWVADMDFACPPAVIDAINERMEHPVFGYMQFPANYWSSIINWHKNRYGADIEQDHIVPVSSVLTGVAMAVQGLTEKGDSILVPTPGYHAFYNAVINNERKLVSCPMDKRQDRYELNFDLLEQQLISEDVKMVLFCSPHNPTGRIWARDELAKLVNLCYRHHVYLVSDEIHSDMTLTHPFTAIFSAHSQAKEIAIALYSPTKTFNIAGLCTAYAVIKNEGILNRFNQAVLASGLKVKNTLGVCALIGAYEKGGEWADALQNYLLENARLAVSYIEKHIPGIRAYLPEATYFLWIDFSPSGLSPEQIIEKCVYQAHVAVTRGTEFIEGGESFVRLNYACPRSLLMEALQRLEKVLNQ